MKNTLLAFTALLILASSPIPFAQAAPAQEEIKLMLLTGRSGKYHAWEGTGEALLQHLQAARIFDVDVVTTTPNGQPLGDFAPNWSDYQAIVLNWEGEEWPEKTKDSFVKYMKNGGGLIVVHAANNAFPYWPEYNEIIGLGGWGGSNFHSPPLYPNDPSKKASRNEKWGPRVHWRGCEALHDHSPGGAGHPPRHDFLITVRNLDHPITSGLPEMWLHSNDELYSNLRGPAKNMTLLATGFANPSFKNASPYNEPILFTVNYGKGRVFHTTLGHVGAKQDANAPAVNNVGFITTLQRGAEWAATSAVTVPVPDDFPHAYQASVRSGPTQGWTSLLDPDLSQWEIFIGVPHTSVKGLPAGAYQSDKVTAGTPLGLNNDPKKVFTTRQENGETLLHITGEIYGALSSHNEYENYHLQMQMRWGDKKWEPRLERKRDSGILYHCQGEHGAFWKVWESSLEYQIQESDFGDFITLAGTAAKAPYDRLEERSLYNPKNNYEPWGGYLHAAVEPDAPQGEWNTLDLYVVGDQAIHVVNGKVVMSLKDATGKGGQPLTRGQIQIQSEAAEADFKNIRIRSIDTLPEILKQKARL